MYMAGSASRRGSALSTTSAPIRSCLCRSLLSLSPSSPSLSSPSSLDSTTDRCRDEQDTQPGFQSRRDRAINKRLLSRPETRERGCLYDSFPILSCLWDGAGQGKACYQEDAAGPAGARLREVARRDPPRLDAPPGSAAPLPLAFPLLPIAPGQLPALPPASSLLPSDSHASMATPSARSTGPLLPLPLAAASSLHSFALPSPSAPFPPLPRRNTVPLPPPHQTRASWCGCRRPSTKRSTTPTTRSLS